MTHAPTDDLRFSTATPADALRIADLVNAAYRGTEGAVGWTHEAHLFDGPRTAAAEIARIIAPPDSVILLCAQVSTLVGSVHLKRVDGGAYLGLLAILPALQGAGVGGRLISEAERFVHSQWGAPTMKMSVLEVRTELIAYYERRGYRRTGVVEPLTLDGQAGRPKTELRLAWLDKPLG